MKPIRIDKRDSLQACLDDVQKRARVRIITVDDIVDTCTDVFRHVGISKKALSGSTFTADVNAQKFSSAYKGIPESTVFSAVYKGNTWYITSIERGRTFSPSCMVRMNLTNDAKTAVLRRMETFEIR